ncbi:MAG TPA: hypothetical protein VMU84_11230 [Thermoanaerobaculia bacterium]|nr:hypothetical protein [Thermoanaerobaculia bacterium]
MLADEHAFRATCKGVPDAKITGRSGVDFSYGTIDYRGDRISFAWGTVGVDVPSNRRPGFRWMRTAKFGDVNVAYGRDVTTKPHTLRASLFPCRFQANFTAVAGDEAKRDRFVSFIRAFAESGCDCRLEYER